MEAGALVDRKAELGISDDCADDSMAQCSSKGSSSGAAKSAVVAVAMLGDEAAAALPVLGPIGLGVGVFLSAGIAIHGWTSQKFSQKEVRGAIEQLKSRLVCFEFLLARLGRLECPLCSHSIAEAELAQRSACIGGRAAPLCPACDSTSEDDAEDDVVQQAGQLPVDERLYSMTCTSPPASP